MSLVKLGRACLHTKAAYNVLQAIQNENSNPLVGHVRYIADNKLVFAAHLAKHDQKHEFCSAFVAVGPDGRVVGLGVDRQAFPKECDYIPTEIAQQITATLVGFAAAGVVESPVLTISVSRQEACPTGLFGLLTSCGMHRHGKLLVGRPREVVAKCKAALQDKHDLCTEHATPTKDLVWLASKHQNGFV